MSDKDLILKYVEKEKQKEALEKLAEGYPVQYIIGNVDFYNINILVNEDVLIPRFETEYLVDDILKLIKEQGFINPNILDIGTGSGCIAISLSKNIDANVCGIDISKKAIDIAKQNNKLNNTNVNFKSVDLNDYTTSSIDVLVSNPPYVEKGSEIDEKIKYEPQDAIYSYPDDIKFYKDILNKYSKYMNKKSIIAFEIGNNQNDRIVNEIKKYYQTSKIISKKDLNGYDRYIYVINE